MAKRRLPTVDSDDGVWGSILNTWLEQIAGDANGGLNYAAADPALTSDHEGYTYINTADNEIKRLNSDGTTWTTLLSGGAVSADNGLTNNSGTIELGGTLTKNTVIDSTDYNFYISGGGSAMQRYWQTENTNKGLTVTADYAVLFVNDKQISLHRSVQVFKYQIQQTKKGLFTQLTTQLTSQMNH